MPDIITAADELHANRMERGSRMLLEAICDARNGVDPKTPKKVMWCTRNGGDATFGSNWGRAA